MPNKDDLPLEGNKPKRFNKSFAVGLIISSILAILIAISIYSYQINTLGMTEESDRFNVLSDSFSIPGLLFILSYGLVMVSNAGAFDMFNYAIGLSWTNVFHKNIRESKFANSYAEYKEMKRAKEKRNTSYIFYVGTLFLLIGVLFLILFYSSK